ncbi:MAG: Hpt domain-containing protein [Magnetococcus sp. DMHC-6]
MGTDSAKIPIIVDKDLEEIIPGYLKNRLKDMILLPQALASGDFETLRVLGHRMKGSGAGYGFAAITEFGKKIEIAASKEDPFEIEKNIIALGDYLNRVEICYK